MRLIFTLHALKDTDQRLFPASKNRSARIRKKLIKRHGSEFVRVPAIYQVGDTLIAHPSFQAQIEAATQPAPSDTYWRSAVNNYMPRPAVNEVRKETDD